MTIKLFPLDSLNYLGFDRSAEGIINPEDVHLHSQALRLMGRTMNVDDIELEGLRELHNSIPLNETARLTNLWYGGDGEPGNEAVELFRMTLKDLLHQTDKRTDNGAIRSEIQCINK
jgi:hypothetical protein